MADMIIGRRLNELPFVSNPVGSEVYGERFGDSVRIKVGDPLGLTTLDAEGKVPADQIPAEIAELRGDLADDGGAALVKTKRAEAGAFARTQEDVNREVVSVLAFIDPTKHAAIRAGSNTDNLSTQLQAAITAAQGRVLDLREGVYHAAGLTGLSNVHLRGAGKGRTILRRPANALTTDSVLLFDSKTGFTVTGVTVDGNEANETIASQACTISNCSGFTVADSEFINGKAVSGGYGVGLAVVDCPAGDELANIRRNTFANNNLQGLLVMRSVSVNICDNFAADNGGDGIQLADYTFPPTANAQSKITLANNHCQGNNGSGIAVAGYFVGGVLGTPIYGPNTASSFISITGNRCSANFFYGIAWQGAFGTVAGNVCHDNGGFGFGAGILFNGLSATCIGNSCYNNEIWGIDAGGSYHSIVDSNACFSNGDIGINMGASVDCRCSNNQVVLTGSDADTGISMPGIDGDGTTPFPTVGGGTVIEGNKIVLNGHAGTRGITVSRDYRNATVRNNVVSGATAANQAYIFEVDRINHHDNEDTYLLESSGGHVIVVASASPLVIPDHADVVFVSGNTSITNMRTYSQNAWDGKVRDVRMSAQGSGYVVGAPPTVNFSGGGGSGAAATAEVDNGGRIVGVTITNPGSGYTSAPSVSFTGGGGGTGAAGAALIGCGNSNGREIQLLFQGTLTVNDGGNLNLAGNLSATPNAATLRLLGAYGGNFYEIGRTTGL